MYQNSMEKEYQKNIILVYYEIAKSYSTLRRNVKMDHGDPPINPKP